MPSALDFQGSLQTHLGKPTFADDEAPANVADLCSGKCSWQAAKEAGFWAKEGNGDASKNPTWWDFGRILWWQPQPIIILDRKVFTRVKTNMQFGLQAVILFVSVLHVLFLFHQVLCCTQHSASCRGHGDQWVTDLRTGTHPPPDGALGTATLLRNQGVGSASWAV